MTDVCTLEPVPSVGTWSSTLCHTFTLGRADRSAQGVAGRVVSGPDALGRPPSCPAPSFVTCFSEKLGLLRRRPESLTLADSHQAGAQRVALCSVFLRLVVRAGGRAVSGLRFRGTAVDGCGALLCRGQVVHPLRVPQHCWWAASRRHRTRPPVHVAQLCPPPTPHPAPTCWSLAVTPLPLWHSARRWPRARARKKIGWRLGASRSATGFNVWASPRVTTSSPSGELSCV